jgi:predicted RNase H-like HicB family nuclease
MDVTVLLEALPTDGFRATSLTPKGFMAEAQTREAALTDLGEQVRKHLASGELVQLRVPLPNEAHPWNFLAGTWKDHPDALEIEQDLKEYRRQVDADPDRL